MEAIVKDIKELIVRSGVVVPRGSSLLLSHHYGIEKFRRYGAGVITCFNKEYAKKYLIMLPGQMHPMHYHKIKAESFLVLHGDMVLSHIKPWQYRIRQETLGVGDWIHMEVAEKHDFQTEGGCVFEEISSRENEGDSYYDDQEVQKDRKTVVGEL